MLLNLAIHIIGADYIIGAEQGKSSGKLYSHKGHILLESRLQFLSRNLQAAI